MAEIKIVELNATKTKAIELTTQESTEILGGFYPYDPSLPTTTGPFDPTTPIPGNPIPGPLDPNFPIIFPPTFPI